MQADFAARLTSRKFLLTVGVVAFAVIGVITGQLTYDAAAEAVRNAVVAYLVAEGAPDFVTRFFEAKKS